MLGLARQPTSAAVTPRFLWAFALFGLLFAVYMSNAYTAGNNDATANVRLPLQILQHGRMTFTPEDSPFMFTWLVQQGERTFPARFRSWNQTVNGETPRDYQKSGALGNPKPKYYLVPTQRPEVYANTFGLGTGLLALPALAVVKPFAGSFEEDATVLWQVGKVVAAASVAGSAVFLFLAALPHLSYLSAFLLALIYALCTCAWSVSSQILVQHGPAELFLAMGTYFFLKKTNAAMLLAGLAYSAAVACRPTCFLVIAVMAIWLAITDRQSLVRFCLGALPIGLMLVGYSWHTFGDPWAPGQLLVGSRVAMSKTGSTDLWQTPFLVGATGLLVSPARGLLVFSPVVVVALWGMGRVWRDRQWADLRPLTLAALALFLPATKRFDWWGGWSYGYRLIMEAVTLLAFLAIPVVASLAARRWRMAVVGVLTLWSFGVQVVGAYAYDVSSWDGRAAYDVLDDSHEVRATFDDRASAERQAQAQGGQVKARSLNVDRPENRHRLWSWSDNPILFYVQNWGRVRQQRQQDVVRFMHQDG